MPGQFTADADNLRSAAEFLDTLSMATESTGVEIVDSFTIQLTEEAGTIEAIWDGDRGRYVLDDRVGA